ncbi:TonB-dependent receptor [Novosphingobium flavum]|uniref:TonB-dependent receptor n=1 Tax=Novosphingobium flavum TaxID=1778672 RepID=A0A7X1KM02_9SPHN|nr:TonB-dependent receptor [Novosphingobium flavum]MBC2666119.1 TonB-dependent receptor [Novosphingobium flavum]
MKDAFMGGVSAIACVMALALSGTAAAQTAPAADDSAEEARDEAIVVTGSRLQTGFSTPTPVTAIAAEDLVKTAPTTVAESLQQLPALSGTQVSSSSGRGSGNSQTNGQSNLNLRGMGTARTLVLFNGSRLGPTNVVGSVDVNIIPKELIQKVDVVTGGASASYGSDAVAGVVNFVLDTRFKGLKLNASKGVTTYGDNPNTSLSAAFGAGLGDRVRIVGSADYFKSKGIPYGLNGRGWMDHPTAGYPNPVAGGVATIMAPDVRVSNASYGGLITSVGSCPAGTAGDACRALVGKEFVGNGILQPFQYGTNVGSAFMSGGNGPIATNGITPDEERYAFFGHAELDLAADHTLWVEGLYSNSKTYTGAQPSRVNGATAFTIYEGNAYLPSSVSSVLAGATGTQTFRLARYGLDWPTTDVRGNTMVVRGALGIKGNLGGDWSYDAMAAYQHAHQDLDILNSIENRKYAAADAVIDPSTGNIVCRVTLTNPGLYPGCVPINLFGNNVANKAATDWIMAWNTADIDLNQTSGEANVRGSLGFGLPAGNISAAFGGAARKLTAKRTVDALSDDFIDGTGIRGFPASLQGRYGSYAFYNPSPLSGEVKVYEFYGELGIPLIADKPLFESLAATVAGRYTHYSTSGWEPTWKLGLNWTVSSAFRLRATYSQDSRAPNILELFNSAQVTTLNSVAPYSTAPTQYKLGGQAITVGNPKLETERAKTLTVGAIISPPFVPGLQLSVDYYRISVKGSIDTPGSQQVIDQCHAGVMSYCNLIVFNNTTVTPAILDGLRADDPVFVTVPMLNFGSARNSGIDAELLYRTRLGSGDLRLRATGTLLLDVRDPGGCLGGGRNEVGSHGLNCSYPRLRGNLSANYSNGPFSVFLQERFIQGGVADGSQTEGVTISSNSVPNVWYTDLNLSAKIGNTWAGDAEVYFNVTNVFNQAPPPTTTAVRSWVEASNPALYDLLGRRFVVGVRFKM